MDTAVLDALHDNGLSGKEALVYVTCLQLGQAPASSIARHMRENRVTVYSILKNLATKWIVKSTTKKNTTYYSVIDPEQLAQKALGKAERLKAAVPELMAMTSQVDTHVKTEFYEGLEGLKTIYEKILNESDKDMLPGEPFLVIMGTGEIDPRFHDYIEKDFLPFRMGFPRWAKAILSNHTSGYADYMHKTHDCIIIDDPLFTLAHEIVLYGKDRIALMMYAPSEMAAVLVQSKTLYDGLKSMFNVIRKMHKQLQKKK